MVVNTYTLPPTTFLSLRAQCPRERGNLYFILGLPRRGLLAMTIRNDAS